MAANKNRTPGSKSHGREIKLETCARGAEGAARKAALVRYVAMATTSSAPAVSLLGCRAVGMYLSTAMAESRKTARIVRPTIQPIGILVRAIGPATSTSFKPK